MPVLDPDMHMVLPLPRRRTRAAIPNDRPRAWARPGPLDVAKRLQLLTDRYGNLHAHGKRHHPLPLNDDLAIARVAVAARAPPVPTPALGRVNVNGDDVDDVRFVDFCFWWGWGEDDDGRGRWWWWCLDDQRWGLGEAEDGCGGFLDDDGAWARRGRCRGRDDGGDFSADGGGAGDLGLEVKALLEAGLALVELHGGWSVVGVCDSGWRGGITWCRSRWSRRGSSRN